MIDFADLRVGQTVRVTDVVYEGVIGALSRDGLAFINGHWCDFRVPGRTVEVLAEPEPDYIDGAWYSVGEGDHVYRQGDRWRWEPDGVEVNPPFPPPYILIVPPGYGPVTT